MDIKFWELPTILKTGRFVSVDFVKKNHEKRRITGRVGVAKHTKGGKLAFSPDEKGMVLIWESTKRNRKDEKDKGYRLVTLNRVISVRANGEVYQVI